MRIYWHLITLEKGKSESQDVAPDKSTMLQWITSFPRISRKQKVVLMDLKKKKEKDNKDISKKRITIQKEQERG